jgi:UDP:flavonoid glycosyltransferase YjiC (YdhE family)
MSSTFQEQVGCLQRVIDSLGALPVRTLVTTGPAVAQQALRPAANTTIVPSAPHRTVLEQAALTVSHGGHGTVMKALAAGVPLVLMPHGRDQADTAVRVSARGGGVTIARTAGVARIRAAARCVLENRSYQRAARRLGDAIERDARCNRLVEELEDIPRAAHKETQE